MMANEYDIVIRAQDKTGRTLSKIEGQLRGLQRTGTSIGQSGAGLAGLTRFITPATVAVTALGAAFTKTAGFALESARQMENTVNQLRLVTNGQADFINQQGRLAQLARDNRASFDSTVELFTKLKVATEELGYSTGTVEELTSKMSKALVVAGADANTANGVIRQFGQAMASGVVRGDEFNSIVEGLGPALNIMARESGVTVGQLREMAGNGELTAEVFAKMLLNSNELDKSFGKLAPTMDQVNQQLDDSLTRLGDSIDKFFGLSEGIKAVKTEAAELAEGLAKALEPPTESEKLLDKIEEIDKRINQAKANLLTLGTDSTADPGIEYDLGAFLNPNATQKELDKAVRRAGMGFGETGSINAFGSSAIQAEQAALDSLIKKRQEYINALNEEGNARKRALAETIRTAVEEAAAAKAAEEAAAAAEELAAKNKKLAQAYKEYAMTRIEGERLAKKAAEEAAKAQERMDKVAQGLINTYRDSTSQIAQNKLEYERLGFELTTIQSQLKENTALTAAEKQILEEATAAIEKKRSALWNMTETLILGGTEIAKVHALLGEKAKALKTNQEEYEELTRLTKIYNDRLGDQAYNQDEVQRTLEVLYQLLGLNRQEYEALTGEQARLNAGMTEGERLLKQVTTALDTATTKENAQAEALKLAREQLEKKLISLDRYAEIVEEINAKADPVFATPEQRTLDAIKEVNLKLADAAEKERILGELRKKFTDDELRRAGVLPKLRDKELTASQQLLKSMEKEDEKLANLKKALENVDEATKNSTVSAEEYTKALEKQIERLTPAKNAAEAFAREYAEARDEFAELTALQNNKEEIARLAQQYGVSERKISAHIRKMRYNMGEFYDAGTSVGQMVKDHFADLGDGLAKNLTHALMRGKEGFESFKDYLKGWANHLIESIIEKMLIQPMIDQLTNWMGLTNKIVPTLAGQLSGMGGGGAGAGMAGGAISAMLKPVQGPNLPGAGGGFWSGLGNWFSGAWSGISNWASGLWSGVSNWFSNIFSGFYANGGYIPAGKVGIAGEAGMELISGPANVTPMEDIGGGGALTVNFNINAIDPGTGTEFILEHRTEIEGIIQNAYNKRGREGIYG